MRSSAKLFALLFGICTVIVVHGQEIDPARGLLREYHDALSSQALMLEELDILVDFDGAGPALYVVFMGDGVGDALEIRRVVLWLDTLENTTPRDGEVVPIDVGFDGSIETSLLHARFLSEPPYDEGNVVALGGAWQRAVELGIRVPVRALLLAEFELEGRPYAIRSDSLIEFLEANGISELPE